MPILLNFPRKIPTLAWIIIGLLLVAFVTSHRPASIAVENWEFYGTHIAPPQRQFPSDGSTGCYVGVLAASSLHLERATLHLLVSILATSPSKPFVLIVPKFHTASKKSPLAHSPSFESALRAMNVKIYHQDAIFVPDGLHPNQPSWTFAYQKFLAWTIDEETCTGKKPIPGRNNGKSFGSHSVLLLDLDQILLRNMERLFDGFERYLSEYSAFCAGDYLQGGCNIMSPYMMSNILLFRPNQTTFEALVNILRSMPTKDWPYFGGDQHLLSDQLPKLEGKPIKILPPETQMMPFECACLGTTHPKNLSAIDAIHFTWGTKPWLLERQYHAKVLRDTKCIREVIAMRRSVIRMASSYCARLDDPLCLVLDRRRFPDDAI